MIPGQSLYWIGSIRFLEAQDKCRVRIERLQELGHELRRPEADYLRDGIYELRVGLHGSNYRVMYFFHHRTAVLTHGLMKERVVPSVEITKAFVRKIKFIKDPRGHTYQEAGI